MSKQRAAHVVARVVVVFAVVVAGVAACALPPAPFGKPCDATHACDSGYVCFADACVNRGFPLLDGGVLDGGGADDGGVSDGGAADGGAGEGEGEGAGGPGEDCTNAIPLAFGAQVAGSTTGRFDDNSDDTGCGPATAQSGSPDVVYAIDMPANQALHVVVDNDYFGFVKVLTSCLGPPITDGCQGTVLHHIDLVVPDPPDGPLFIMVDGFNADAHGTFTLRATAR